MQADKLTSAEGDSTEHAHQQRCKFIAELEKLGLKPNRALAENCYRHLAVLEESAAMNAAFPGEELVNMLRMIHEVLHSQPLYYEQLWGFCGLPMDVFRQLSTMPEPTTSKWEVMQLCARVFLIVLGTAPGAEGLAMGMMEEFTKFTLDRMRGSVDLSRPQDASGHPHRLKWQAISAVLASPERSAGLYFILDMWEFHGVRHEFCKSKSKYGSFSSGHHRHEMAVRVCKDLVWYEDALASPSNVFKQTEKFLERNYRRRFLDRITDTTRASVRLRMRKALEAGQESLLKWSAEVWTRARHLLGAVCDEKYRTGAAQLVLILLGYSKQLSTKLAEQPAGGGGRGGGGDGGGGGAGGNDGNGGNGSAGGNGGDTAGSDSESRMPEAERRPASGSQHTRTRIGPSRVEAQPLQAPTPVDAVQGQLFKLIHRRHLEGSLAKEWELWGLGEHLTKWLTLATAGEADTTDNPVLSPELTPRLYEVYIDMLFVGMGDNTRLESYVSLYKTFAHVNSTGTSMEEMFMYHAELEADRMLLRRPDMRSTTGGALKQTSQERAAKAKLLPHHAASKKQLQELCRMALARASAVDCKRYFSRGEAGLKRKCAAERLRQEEFKVDAARRMARAQTATKEVGAAGRKRKAVLPPEAYMYLLNPLVEAGGIAPKRQGTGYGNTSLKKRKSIRAKEKPMAKPPPRAKVPQPTRSGKRRTERQLRQLGTERPLPQLKKSRKKRPKRAAAPNADQLASAGLADELDAAAHIEEEELRRAEAEAAEVEAAAERRREREADLQKLFEQQAAQREAEAAAAAERAAEEAADRTAAAERAELLRAHERVELETYVCPTCPILVPPPSYVGH